MTGGSNVCHSMKINQGGSNVLLGASDDVVQITQRHSTSRKTAALRFYNTQYILIKVLFFNGKTKTGGENHSF